MENFVFPDEIKAKLIKMNEEHFFTIQKLKRPLRIPQNRTKENKLNQIRSQKIWKIGKVDYPISDSSTGLGYTKRPIQHTLVYQLSDKTPFIVIHPLVWAWKGVRHRVSDSVFKVTRIIE